MQSWDLFGTTDRRPDSSLFFLSLELCLVSMCMFCAVVGKYREFFKFHFHFTFKVAVKPPGYQHGGHIVNPAAEWSQGHLAYP